LISGKGAFYSVPEGEEIELAPMGEHVQIFAAFLSCFGSVYPKLSFQWCSWTCNGVFKRLLHLKIRWWASDICPGSL